MATTKAFELAQLSALTTVDASGNVTTNTSQIANASGDLTFDSVAGDIVLDAHGNQVIFKGSGGQVGFIDLATGRMDIKSSTADQEMRFQGNDNGVPINALVLDMAASGAATFLDQVTIGGNLIHAGNLTIDAGGDITLDADGADIILADATVAFGRFKQETSNLVIKAETVDKDIVFRGTKTGSPNVTIDALVLDMSNDGRATFNENVVIQGNLTVEGTSVTLNTTDLNVEDKNITLNYHASNDTSASAGGAGITIQDAVDASTDASILWDATNDKFDFSHAIDVTGSLSVSSNLGIGGSTATSAILSIPGDDTITKPQIRFISGIATNLADAAISTTDDSGGTNVLIGSNLYYSNSALARFDTTRSGSGIDFGYTGNMKLYTGSGNNAPTEKMRLGSSGDISFYEDNSGTPQVGMHWDYTDGRLGIGTDSPGALLDVNDDGVTDNAWNTLAKFRPDLSDAHAEASIHIQSYPSTTVVADRRAGIQSIDDAGNARSLILNKDGGNVGIGVGSPAQKLDVNGKIRFTPNTADTNYSADIGARYDSAHPFELTVKNNGSSSEYFGVYADAGGANNRVALPTGNVGIGTTDPNALLHISGTSPHMDVGPHGGNRAKFGYHDLDVIIGSTSSTGEIIFKNNISSTGAPQTDGDIKVKIADVGMTIYSDTYNILDIATDTNDDQTSTDGIVKITNGASHTTKAEFRWDESEDLVHVSYGDHGRHVSINSSGNVGIGTGSVSPTHTLDVNGAIGTRQVRHDLQPSLSFDFANSKTLDPRIQYQRRGTATYFDDSGVMRYATHNVPRIDHDPSTGECKGLLVEEERTNFMPYPNEFGFGQWTTPGLVPIQNVGLAPDGTYSADLIMLDYSYTSRHFGYRGVTGAFLSGATYNISCYFKAFGGFSESCKLGYRVDSDTQSGDLYGSGFQINAGEPAGNGWYRHSLTVTVGTNATFNFAEFILGDQNGYQPTAGTGVYMWGFTVEKASDNTATFPTSFIPTRQNLTGRASTTATYTRSDGVITTAGQHQPRYDHALKDGIWRPKGLLLESAATNLSANFYYPASTLRWNSGVQNATITPDVSVLAPDGTYNNVVRFKETTNSAATTASVYKPIVGTANTQRTFSVYAKKKELKMMRLYFDGTTPLCGQVIYNLDLGTIHIAQNPSGTDAWGIEDAGNGWWRCWFSGTVTGGQATYYVHIDSADDFGNVSHQNTVNNGFYLWGPQMEYGGAPTSYIYTDDSATTRTADLAESEAVTREGDNIKMYDMSFHNTIESTIYGEATSISGNNDVGSNPCLWGLTDGTSSNRYLLRRFSNDTTNDPTYSGFTFRLQQTMPDGTSYNNDFFSPTANGLGEWDDAEIHKMALSISPGNQIGAADGTDAGMTSVTSMPPYTQPTMVEIGFAGSSDYWNGHIRKLAYYPTQLNITELKALTESD